MAGKHGFGNNQGEFIVEIIPKQDEQGRIYDQGQSVSGQENPGGNFERPGHDQAQETQSYRETQQKDGAARVPQDHRLVFADVPDPDPFPEFGDSGALALAQRVNREVADQHTQKTHDHRRRELHRSGGGSITDNQKHHFFRYRHEQPAYSQKQKNSQIGQVRQITVKKIHIIAVKEGGGRNTALIISRK